MNQAAKLPPLILASTSPRRHELLTGLGVTFRAVPSPAEEVRDENLTAVELAQLNAHLKARAVAKRDPDALVLGADTLVYMSTTVFGKPATLGEAHRMLLDLQGRTHRVVTGVSLMHLRQHRERLFASVSEVTFRALNPADIAEYLRLVNPMDKAGAYAVQEHGERIIEQVNGLRSNVIGLPVELVKQELDEWCDHGRPGGTPGRA